MDGALILGILSLIGGVLLHWFARPIWGRFPSNWKLYTREERRIIRGKAKTYAYYNYRSSIQQELKIVYWLIGSGYLFCLLLFTRGILQFFDRLPANAATNKQLYSILFIGGLSCIFHSLFTWLTNLSLQMQPRFKTIHLYKTGENNRSIARFRFYSMSIYLFLNTYFLTIGYGLNTHFFWYLALGVSGAIIHYRTREIWNRLWWNEPVKFSKYLARGHKEIKTQYPRFRWLWLLYILRMVAALSIMIGGVFIAIELGVIEDNDTSMIPVFTLWIGFSLLYAGLLELLTGTSYYNGIWNRMIDRQRIKYVIIHPTIRSVGLLRIVLALLYMGFFLLIP